MIKIMDFGFHGDQYLLKTIDSFMNKIKYFVESGTYVGSTAVYVAKNYQNLNIISCEKNHDLYQNALYNTKNYEKIELINKESPNSLQFLFENKKQIFEELNFYYLDAHIDDHSPLRDEISFLTKNTKEAIILIDDAQVPNQPQFKFDRFSQGACGFDYIKEFFNQNQKYNIYYPNYTEHTSTFHPLVGYMFVLFGESDLSKEIINIFDKNIYLTKEIF